MPQVNRAFWKLQKHYMPTKCGRLVQSLQEDVQATQARVQAAKEQMNPLNNRLIKQLLSR